MSKRSDAGEFLKDGNVTFSGGMDAGRSPSDIDHDQVALAINCTVRGGDIRPRPGWIQRLLTFPDALTTSGFETSFFQGSDFFDGGGFPMLVSSHSGRQFAINLSDYSVFEITPTASISVVTTSAFTVPADNATVNVITDDNSRFTISFPSVTIGGYQFTLTNISTDGLTITVKNTGGVTPGTVVASISTITFNSWDINNPTLKKTWQLASDHWFTIQDNQDKPIIFDGAKTYRSDIAKGQIPVGNVMCYAQGRLLVALTDRRTYVAGNLYGDSSSGTAAWNYADSILYFTNNRYLNEAGEFVARVFGAPSSAGDILSMGACSQSDQQLGQGSVLIGTPNVTFTVNLPFDQTTWQSSANILQTANPIIGPVSQDSTIPINNDMAYRSQDGARTYVMAQRQFNGSWGNTSISNEVDVFLNYDTGEWLEWGSAVFFDNRWIQTISPQMCAQGVYHRGLVVMDMNLASGLRKKFAPCWEGMWVPQTGKGILRIVRGKINNVDHCWMYVLNNQAKIELWEMTSDDTQIDDVAYVNGVPSHLPISGRFELPSYSCGDLDRYKSLEAGRILVSEVSGTWNYSVEYRTDDNPCWVQWVPQSSVCSLNQDCGPWGTSVTTTTSEFTLPVYGSTVTIPVASITGIAINQWLTIGNYSMLCTGVGSGAVTVKNSIYQPTQITNTTALFTFPSLSVSATVDVKDTFSLIIGQTINIGGYIFTCTGVNSTSSTIQVRNDLYSNPPVATIPSGYGVAPWFTVSSGTAVVVASCNTLHSYLNQPRRPIRLPQPPDDFDKISNQSNRCGYEIQPRIIFQGYAAVKQFRIFAKDTPEMLGVDRMDTEVPSPVPATPCPTFVCPTGIPMGQGSPQGSFYADPGTLYWDALGNGLWIKNTGTDNNGWQQLLQL